MTSAPQKYNFQCGGRRRSHGLSLLEFILALMITGLISAVMGGMVTAVARATELDRHTRETVVRSQAASVRLSSYVTPSRCILAHTSDSLVIWLDDSRESETVHATEVRWIKHNLTTDTIELHYIKFPESMSQIERDLLDTVLPVATTDWWATLASFESLTYTDMVRLCDGVGTMQVDRDTSSTQAKRLVTFTLTYADALGGEAVVTAAGIRELKEPTS